MMPANDDESYSYESTSPDVVDFYAYGVDLGDEVDALLDRLKRGEDIFTVYRDFKKFRRKWVEEYIPMFAARVGDEYDDLAEFLRYAYTLGLDWKDGDNLPQLLEAFVGLMWWKADRMTPNSFFRLNSCLYAIEDAFYKEVNIMKKEDGLVHGNV